ncbi:hypothetical protein MPTK1_6g13120 [Marchantia polymorpha subsp. ruderalis]|uniref:Phosducin domain-containing protein n=2 Tax=Marchantia polymorpha TaxID=3197 RepID=A0A176W9W9_MARPO|nr:hypothetical protein AXG93_2789s1220 [Marchantia polymorpha subsp. ruderalis]PTQ37090.1 hypothetical protein MARPO_0059s0038 [Marchantia polymorpha]BBN14633.1 hypothetical protein Mp_6g13120 [Marchantia polymorpha subsp. ruderalis]|eukprot:PTQ37090.1 hypothetical protein MARPO_0059s0038 [Marchantia polymorpha]
MSDYHFVYKDVEGTSTQWDDIQTKLGNRPAKPAPHKPPAWSPAEDERDQVKNKEWMSTKTVEELEDLADDPDLDDDRFMEEYRKKRMQELTEKTRKARFGSVVSITGSDFIREVSQAPPDVWVVVHLYKDGNPNSELLGQCLDDLATKYTGTKFVKIVSTDCIKDYPDFNLPTLLVYNNTNVKATLVGLQHYGGRRCTPEDVAFKLVSIGPVLLGPNDDDREAVTERVRRDFLEKIVSKLEQKEADSDDD